MSTLPHLWLPILLSGVAVFVASNLVHMVLKWHAGDYRPLANEDAVREVIRAGSPTPGQYVMPHCGDMKRLGEPDMQRKFAEGPVAFLVVAPSGPPAMGRSLGLWFLFTVLVGFFTAYVAALALLPGTHYLRVFRIVGCVAFMAYGFGGIPQAIWMGRPWRAVALDLLDALIYGLLTAGVFGWLWPR